MRQSIVFLSIILCFVCPLVIVQGYTGEKNETPIAAITTNNNTLGKSLMPFKEIKQGLVLILSNITDLQARNEAASQKIRNRIVELTATTTKEPSATTTEINLSVQPPSSTNNSETTTQLDQDEVATIKSVSDRTDETHNTKQLFDYQELYVFNSWVTLNLDYAQQNTNNTMISLEAESDSKTNKGFVHFSNDTLTDGFEGVRYWNSAVTFQEKALDGKDFHMEQFQPEGGQN